MIKQLAHNMTHPFKGDPNLGEGKLVYYPPTRIVHLLHPD